jgi:hypothetical protein
MQEAAVNIVDLWGGEGKGQLEGGITVQGVQ